MASEYLKWKYRDVKPDAPVQLTPRQRAANWWQYHKWWLLVCAVLLFAGGDILLHALGIGTVKPDYQLACVVSSPLSDDALAALENRITALGEDCNGDGRVVVQIHPYVDMANSPDGDQPGYAYAARVKLMADLEACESYFFICDDPETLHDNYDVLANASGEIAGPSEAIDCRPVLDALAADHPQLRGLYLARRGFWRDRTCQYREQCDALWAKLS